MIELAASEKPRQFVLHKCDSLPRSCRECDVRFACHGECPKNRFIETPDGEPGSITCVRATKRSSRTSTSRCASWPSCYSAIALRPR